MRVGQTGPDIVAIQQALNIRSKGPRIPEDGAFGPKTESAVKNFQATNRLVADGIVGPRTRSVLYPLVATTINLSAARFGDGGRGRPPLSLVPPAKLALQSMRPPGLLLPLQGAAPMPPPSPRLKFDSFQLSPGGQIAFAGLSTEPKPSLALTLQTVFKRGEDDGRLELALGLQVGAPIFVQSSDGLPLVVSWFANFNWIDPLGKLGLFHFWSPFATVGGQTDFQARETSVGAGIFPINLTLDSPFTDKINISVNSGVAGTIGLKAQEIEWGFQTTIGVSGTLTLF